MSTQQYVPVYVPEEHLPTVLDVLTSLLSPASRTDPDDAGWSDEMLERLYWDSSGSLTTILVTLASRPNEWVTADELAKALGPDMGWRSVAGALGPLTRKMKAYGMKSWPFRLRKDSKTDRLTYRMDPRTASILLTLNKKVEDVIDGIGKPTPGDETD
jgi:hypothetical protein